MELRLDHSSAKRLFLILVGVGAFTVFATRVPAAVGYAGERLADVVMLLIVAITVTYLVKPAVDFMAAPRGNTHRARMWATLAIFFLLGIGGWVCMRLALQPLSDEWRKIEPLLERTGRKSLQTEIRHQTEKMFQLYQQVIPDRFKEAIETSLSGAAESLLEKLSKTTKGLGDWLRFAVELIAVPVLVFYFLTDGKNLRDEISVLVPRRYEQAFSRFLNQADRVFDGYVRGQLILCGIALVITFLASLLLRLPYALTLGLWGGLTRAIPFVGPVFGGVPMVAVAFFSHDATTAIIALLITTLMHFAESKFIMPKVIGHEVGLHPVTIIVSLLVAFKFFGLVGMFVSAPLVAMAKQILVDYRTPVPESATQQEIAEAVAA